MINAMFVPKVVKRSFRSQQGLSISDPQRGQLHWLKDENESSVIFALVTNVHNGYCDVVPGSKDAFQAGPEDIVLPRDVMGDFVMLSPLLHVTIPCESLGIGFAKLNPDIYNQVIDTVADMILDEDCPCSFERGIQYLGDDDDRLEYHRHMNNAFLSAQRCEHKGDRSKICDWFPNARKIQFWECRAESESEVRIAAACVGESQTRYYRFKNGGVSYKLIVSVSQQRGLVDCSICTITGKLAKDLCDLFIVFGEEEKIEIKNGRCNFPLEFVNKGFCMADENDNEIIVAEC